MIFKPVTVLLASLLTQSCLAQTTAPSTSATVTPSVGAGNRTLAPSQTSAAPVPVLSGPPDVLLNVPQLSVGRIELDVDNLQADVNLNAQVASLVQINAGVQVSVQKINLTIADVDVQLELIVRLGNLVSIVNRVFQSVDLNPLIVGVGNATEALVGGVVGAVDGLLGSITQGGTTLNFLIDNLGNIVQQVVGGASGAVDTVVGNYLQNMTFTGEVSQLAGGLTQKTYEYSPLNALVNVITNTAGQVVQATVQKSGAGTSSTSAATPSATARRR